MTTVFYLMTLIFMGYELWALTHTNFFADLSYGIKQYTEDKAITPELMKGCIVAAFSMFYTAWCIVGLFSSNAKFFLILLLIGALGSILRKLYPKQSPFIVGIDAFVCTVILCVIFINYFI